MEASELIKIISRDEDSKHQFKVNITNEVSAGQEMVAFSNSQGGMLIIGVSDDGKVSGLTRQDMNRLSNLISNAASQQVKPPINPITENIQHEDGLVMVVHISEGLSKPYMDKDGTIFVKSGADKRKATSREELQRMFQSSGLVHGDEVLVPSVSLDDLDHATFKAFYEKEFEEKLEDVDLPLTKLIENLNLGKDGVLNIAGALLFGKSNKYKLPVFIVKCVSYIGYDPAEAAYVDSQDISGNIKAVFDNTINFILRNLRRIQGSQGVNSLGILEVPKIAIEELVINALVHRDYFITAPVRIFIFSDRIEIISPGNLPNNLTIENIKRGNSNIRNPILTSFATKILPYRGLGNGVRRALKAYSDIDFYDDREGNCFKVIIHRQEINTQP